MKIIYTELLMYVFFNFIKQHVWNKKKNYVYVELISGKLNYLHKLKILKLI